MKHFALFSLTIIAIAIIGCSKDESMGDTVFNPDYPDGTDDLIAVNINVTASTPYTVPPDRNFHGYIEAPNFMQYPVIIDGQVISGMFMMHIKLKGGTTISNTSSISGNLSVTGYTSPQKKQVIYSQITGSPYTVPDGKQFYLTWINVTPWNTSGNNPSVSIDGVTIPYVSMISVLESTDYFLVDGGSTITTNAPIGTKIFINGFLK